MQTNAKTLPLLQAHIARWENCKACSLRCDHAPLFYRGTIPCEVLFVAEVPDVSSSRLFSPFSGSSPGAQVLDEVGAICKSWACTYVCSCGPTEEVTKADQEACRPKLAELIALARPKVLMSVGKPADAYILNNMHYFAEVLGYRPISLRMNLFSWIETCKDPILHINKAKWAIEEAIR